MTPNAQAFDNWIRGPFVAINTELEDLYGRQADRMAIHNIGNAQKNALLDEGKIYIVALLKEGNTDEGFDSGFELLGNVGFYMAACRRHGLTDPETDSRSPLAEASGLAMQLGTFLFVCLPSSHPYCVFSRKEQFCLKRTNKDLNPLLSGAQKDNGPLHLFFSAVLSPFCLFAIFG